MKLPYLVLPLTHPVSHPAGVRGLKLRVRCPICRTNHVAPRRGAWIETWKAVAHCSALMVAPRRGAWIETSQQHTQKFGQSRTPQGCVD